MTLLQLRYFVVLAQVLHYTKAAGKLHISQPGLSYAISELEKELGIALFEKRDKRIHLNNFGKFFLPYAEKSLKTLDEGIQMLQFMIDPAHGTVNLGYFYSISATVIPEIIRGFYSTPENSSIVFNFTQNLNSEIVDELKSGKVDLAFCLRNDPAIVSRQLFEQELFLAVPKDHPLASRDSVVLDDFADKPMVMLDEKSGLRSTVNSYFSAHNQVPQVSFDVQECNAVLQFVSLKLGLSIIPRVPAVDALAVKLIPIAGEKLKRPIYLAWDGQRVLPPAVQKVRDYILEKFNCPIDELQP